MSRAMWGCLVGVPAVMVLVGCAQTDTTAQRLRDENGALRHHVALLEADQARLEQDLERAGAAGRIPEAALARLRKFARSSEKWQYVDGRLRTRSSNLFGSGKYRLTPKGTQAVKAVAAVLKEIVKDRGLVVRVDGHSDTDPLRHLYPLGYDLTLHRTQAVVQALRKEGVPWESVASASYDGSQPIPGATKAQNRRIELVLIPKAGAPLSKEAQ